MYKRIITIVILLFVVFVTDIFAATPEIYLNIYGLGGAFGIPDAKFSELSSKADETTLRGDFSYEFSALLQVGYSLDYNKESAFKGVSLFLDIGYYRHAFTTAYTENLVAKTQYHIENIESIIFDSINIGIIPKINFANTSIGIGGGIKMPFKWQIKNTGAGINGLLAMRYRDSEDMSYQAFKAIFKYPFIPYIKIAGDTFLYTKSRFAVSLVWHASYDFLEYEKDKLVLVRNPSDTQVLMRERAIYSKYSMSSVSFGIGLGVYFGRKNIESAYSIYLENEKKYKDN